MADKSVALPFLTKPPKLDGTAPGDFGFDPLGFTNTLQDLRYVKQAEIKHGRVAMLAVVGFLVSQYVHVPGEAYQAADPMKAIDSVGLGCNLQILAGIGFLELANWENTFSGKSEPGDYGFDGGQLKGKSAKEVADLKLKEIKNGRLAMIAIIGLISQNLATGGAPTL